MIWYETPAVIGMIVFPSLLLTAAFQAVIALEAGESLRERRALRFLRLLYVMLAATSVSLSAEALLAIASIEGGVLLPISALPRYMAVLPALLFLYAAIWPVELPPLLRPPVASYFIPLLRLPPVDWLPMPLPIALAVFAAAWFVTDTVRMLLSFKAYARMEITRSVMPEIIRSIGKGICIADRRGWILEGNAAFHDLCNSLGIHKVERIDEIDAALKALCDAGRLNLSDLENGQSIQTGSGVYFLQRSSFKAGKRTFVQLSLSDVTKVTRAAAALEQENNRLAQKNMELESAISDIALEEVIRERERLCRAAHDLWSQRLAVAGLSVDICLSQRAGKLDSGDIAEIAGLLEISAVEESAQATHDLHQLLRGLTDMYRKLGVDIQVSGRAEFTGHQQEALCSVLREALANAVRHTYARTISVRFTEDGETVGMTIINDCLDDEPGILEGRGLHDMKTGVHNAGGSIQYEKSNLFELQVTFLKSLTNLREALAHESRVD